MSERTFPRRLLQWMPVTSHWPRLLLFSATALATITLLIWLGGGQETLALFNHANWHLIGLAVLIHYSGFALRGHRWQRLLAELGYELPYRPVAALLISGWFVSALVPARAGEILRVGALRMGKVDDTPVPITDAVSSVVLERMLDIVAILGLGSAFGFAMLHERLPDWVLVGYGTGMVLLITLGIGLLVIPAILLHLRRLSSHTLWHKGLDFVARLITSLRTLLHRPVRALLLLMTSVAIWLCDALLLWLVVQALGYPLAFAHAAFIALTVDVFATVPLTPGGMGQIELAYTALLSLMALPVSFVPAAVLLTRAISYWSFLGFSGIVASLSGTDALFTMIRKSGDVAPNG